MVRVVCCDAGAIAALSDCATAFLCIGPTTCPLISHLVMAQVKPYLEELGKRVRENDTSLSGLLDTLKVALSVRFVALNSRTVALDIHNAALCIYAVALCVIYC